MKFTRRENLLFKFIIYIWQTFHRACKPIIYKYFHFTKRNFYDM